MSRDPASPYKAQFCRGRELAWRCAAAIDALPRGFAEERTYDQWEMGLLIEMVSRHTELSY